MQEDEDAVKMQERAAVQCDVALMLGMDPTAWVSRWRGSSLSLKKKRSTTHHDYGHKKRDTVLRDQSRFLSNT
jgi:hypothetical protein